MSLVASSITRHLRHQLISPTQRQFAAAATKGLRRPKAGGKPRSTHPNNKQNASSSTNTNNNTPQDPHMIANEMVNSAMEGAAGTRTPGTESIASLTREQKLSNFAMATGLFGFVSYIFYYSLASVGGVDNAKALLFGSDKTETEQNEIGFQEFLKEANEGRTLEEQRLRAEQEDLSEVRELVVLESNEEEEVEMARTAGFIEVDEVVGKNMKTGRPLWKRVVFFWRKE